MLQPFSTAMYSTVCNKTTVQILCKYSHSVTFWVV